MVHRRLARWHGPARWLSEVVLAGRWPKPNSSRNPVRHLLDVGSIRDSSDPSVNPIVEMVARGAKNLLVPIQLLETGLASHHGVHAVGFAPRLQHAGARAG